MVDAQLTNVRVLKPFPNFERVYQGKAGNVPIAFPGTRDPRGAQDKAGFDPNFMTGIIVPQGARVQLDFPMCFVPNPQSLSPFQFYSYRLVWRFNNLGDFRDPPARTRRAPYHFPRESPGANDTTLGPPGLPRVTVPALWHVIAHEEVEPTVGPTDLRVRVETITPRLDALTEFIQPLLPDGQKGVIQQGVLDPATSGGAQMPIFVPFWTDAMADELLILVNRADSTDPWDFTAEDEDLAFSNVYGTGNGRHPAFRDVGIYLQTGTNP
jgi:hypothetical protein